MSGNWRRNFINPANGDSSAPEEKRTADSSRGVTAGMLHYWLSLLHQSHQRSSDSEHESEWSKRCDSIYGSGDYRIINSPRWMIISFNDKVSACSSDRTLFNDRRGLGMPAFFWCQITIVMTIMMWQPLMTLQWLRFIVQCSLAQRTAKFLWSWPSLCTQNLMELCCKCLRREIRIRKLPTTRMGSRDTFPSPITANYLAAEHLQHKADGENSFNFFEIIN